LGAVAIAVGVGLTAQIVVVTGVVLPVLCLGVVLGARSLGGGPAGGGRAGGEG
jgi:hypothetical protein